MRKKITRVMICKIITGKHICNKITDTKTCKLITVIKNCNKITSTKICEKITDLKNTVIFHNHHQNIISQNQYTL